MLRPLQASACTCRIAFGPRAGQKVLTVQGAMRREKDFKQTLCAEVDGFSLRAAVRCGADDRQALEQQRAPRTGSCRRWSSCRGWRHGRSKCALRSLVPRPRLHLIRFHGVLAPNAKLRALGVPPAPDSPAQATHAAECEANCAHHRPVRLSLAKLLERVLDLDLEHCPNCRRELNIIATILRGEPGPKRY